MIYSVYAIDRTKDKERKFFGDVVNEAETWSKTIARTAFLDLLFKHMGEDYEIKLSKDDKAVFGINSINSEKVYANLCNDCTSESLAGSAERFSTLFIDNECMYCMIDKAL